MQTINETQVQLAGASLQVELKNANRVGTPVMVVCCPKDCVMTSAPTYMSQLRGYSR